MTLKGVWIKTITNNVKLDIPVIAFLSSNFFYLKNSILLAVSALDQTIPKPPMSIEPLISKIIRPENMIII